MQNKSWPWPKSSETLTNTSVQNTVEYAGVPLSKQTVLTLKDPGWIVAVFIGALLFLPLLYAALM
jgi:hypothetical protein